MTSRLTVECSNQLSYRSRLNSLMTYSGLVVKSPTPRFILWNTTLLLFNSKLVTLLRGLILINNQHHHWNMFLHFHVLSYTRVLSPLLPLSRLILWDTIYWGIVPPFPWDFWVLAQGIVSSPGLTGNRTQIAGIKTPSDDHYTMRPLQYIAIYLLSTVIVLINYLKGYNCCM